MIDRRDTGVSGFQATYDTYRADHNARMAANALTDWDRLIDFAGNASYGAVGAANNAVLYDVDLCHPNNTGQNGLGAIAVTATAGWI
jgi:hypothetical protein